MLRLTLMLSAAVYAGLVIYSEPASQPGADAPGVTQAAFIDATVPLRAVAADRLTTADGRVLMIAAVIDPVALDQGRDTVHSISTLGAETVVASASAGQPELPLVEVTGASVNLRAGPSTGDRRGLTHWDAGAAGFFELKSRSGSGPHPLGPDPQRSIPGVAGFMADRLSSRRRN